MSDTYLLLADPEHPQAELERIQVKRSRHLLIAEALKLAATRPPYPA